MSTQLLCANRQQGAALVVGMLLLLVLTLLAISGMNTASLELVMAGNVQSQQNAFQAAESGIERALGDGQFNPGVAAPEVFDVPAENFRSTVTRELDGLPLPALWGSSWNSFSSYHFLIQSVGQGARNARVTTEQGVAVIAPFDNSTVSPITGLPATLN